MEHITATILVVLICAGWIALVILAVRALRKYLKSAPVRREKSEKARTLGAVLKEHRTACNDAGVRRGNAGREPLGGFQVGKRHI